MDVRAYIIGGSGSGSLSLQSGHVRLATPTQGRSRGVMMLTNNSGGDQLASGDVHSVTIKFLDKGSGGLIAQSGVAYVGYDADGERPYAASYNSGYGFPLVPGESYTVNIDNMNKIRVLALNSGEMIAYTGNTY